MQHPNKNRLLEYFYREGSEKEIKRTREHLHDCPDCREYLHTLEQTAGILNQLPEEVPPEKTFDLMIKDMDILPVKTMQKRQVVLALPYLQIALSIPFILAVLYFFQSKLRILPVWEILGKYSIIQVLGSYGLVAVIFFLIGSFVTLALAPVLLDSEKCKKHKHIYKLLWR